MNFTARNANILNRIDRHASHPSASDLRKAAERCLALSESFANERDEMVRGGFFTADGRRDKLKEALTKQVAPQMRAALTHIDAAAKGVERLRGQIKPHQVEQTAVAEMRRAELRTYMRGLPLHDRLAALLNNPKYAEAVLDQLPELSGVPQNEYDKAKAARDEQLNGPTLRQIEALEAVVDEATAAAMVARNDLASIAELDKEAFDKLVPARESFA